MFSGESFIKSISGIFPAKTRAIQYGMRIMVYEGCAIDSALIGISQYKVDVSLFQCSNKFVLTVRFIQGLSNTPSCLCHYLMSYLLLGTIDFLVDCIKA